MEILDSATRFCETLSCVDPRTARKHVRFVRAAVKAKLPVVTRRRDPVLTAIRHLNAMLICVSIDSRMEP
jgi:hypothetical protein